MNDKLITELQKLGKNAEFTADINKCLCLLNDAPQGEDLKGVGVRTVPNGYILTLTDGNGSDRDYLYFNVFALVTGMAYHLAYGFTDAEDLDVIADIVGSNEALIKKIQSEERQMQKAHEREVEKLKKRITELEKEG